MSRVELTFDAPVGCAREAKGSRKKRVWESCSGSSRKANPATSLPWKCEIKTRFLDANAGCARSVSGAISWLFEHEESGAILEDDGVPDASFLPYCAEALARHAADERVMSVLGTRYATQDRGQRASYSFTRIFSPWGWASWRRAWKRYELDIGDWRAKRPTRGQPMPDFGAQWLRLGGWLRMFVSAELHG